MMIAGQEDMVDDIEKSWKTWWIFFRCPLTYFPIYLQAWAAVKVHGREVLNMNKVGREWDYAQ